jgi:hypothetical protein
MKYRVLILIIAVLASSCNKELPGAPLDILESYTSSSSLEERLTFLDSRSRGSLQRALSARIVSKKQLASLLPPLVPGTSWQVISDDKGSDPRIITVQITKHPVMNQSGLMIPLTFVSENGRWKINVESTVKGLGKATPLSAEEYLKSKGVNQ